MARQKTSSKLEWLQNRADLQTPEGQTWVRYLTGVHPHADPLLPWLTREWKKGRIFARGADGGRTPDLSPDPRRWNEYGDGARNFKVPSYEYPTGDGNTSIDHLLPGDTRHWMDWYNSQHPTRNGPDGNRIDIGSKQFQMPQMKERIWAWEKQMQEEAEQAKIKEQADAPILHSWPDGWTVRNLKAEHLKYEGEVMGHCVGGYGYADQVRDGDTSIVSLRDPNGRPHATVELSHPGRFGETDEGRHDFDLEKALGHDDVVRAAPARLHDELREIHQHSAQASDRELREMDHHLRADDPEAARAYDLYSALRNKHGRWIPSLNNSRVIQIQGKSDTVPIPEYQARLKEWFQTFPENKRPQWDDEPNEQIEHIGGIVPEAESYNASWDGMEHGEPNDQEGGGYGPHGDYGLGKDESRLIHYPRVVDSLLRARNYHEWRNEGEQKHDPAEVKALYEEALKRGEIPQLAAAATSYGESAQEEYDRLEENNLDYIGAYPGESWDEEPERWAEPHPDYGDWGDGLTPQERWQDAYEQYNANRDELYQSHAPSQLTQELYNHINPHWWGEPAVSPWRNELAPPAVQGPTQTGQMFNYQDPRGGTFSKVARAPHPHLTTGLPCTCPWGGSRLAKTAAKLDWLKGRPDMQTPEAQQLMAKLETYYADSDKLLPWIVREWKKGRLVNTLGDYRSFQIDTPEGGFFTPQGARETQEILDWLKKHKRQGVDVMQHDVDSLNALIYKAGQDKEDEDRMDRGTIFHQFPDGWTIRRLDNREEAHEEGDHMGHCVGQYGGDIEAGNKAIFSLRDHKNNPHATVEIHHNQVGKDGRPLPSGKVHQIQGRFNEEPGYDHKNMLADWFSNIPVTANTTKTVVPAPTDPDELRYWHEPETDYDDQDHYQLSPHQADEYGLGGDEEEFDYQGAPDWDKIIHSTLNQAYDHGQSRVPIHSVDTAHDVHSIAMEHDHGEHSPWMKFNEAVARHQVAANADFYANEYDPDEYSGTAEEQWNNWDKGEKINALLGGQQGLTHDPEGLPLGRRHTPVLHPEQTQLFQPTLCPNNCGGQNGEHNSWCATKPEYGFQYPQYQEPAYGFQPELGDLLGLNLRQPNPLTYAKTAAPLYYRWVFSPTSGEVTIAHNGEAEQKLHGDLARERNEPGLVHGFAYRIGGGFRLTDYESKPLTDPYVAAQVMRTLRGEEGYKPTEDASQDWSEADDDFDRQHHGMPLPAS